MDNESSQDLIQDSKRLIEQSKALIQRSHQGLAKKQEKLVGEMTATQDSLTPQPSTPSWLKEKEDFHSLSLRSQVLAQQKQVEQQWERVALDQERVLEQKRKMGLI